MHFCNKATILLTLMVILTNKTTPICVKPENSNSIEEILAINGQSSPDSLKILHKNYNSLLLSTISPNKLSLTQNFISQNSITHKNLDINKTSANFIEDNSVCLITPTIIYHYNSETLQLKLFDFTSKIPNPIVQCEGIGDEIVAL